jgi:hypothetical protein
MHVVESICRLYCSRSYPLSPLLTHWCFVTGEVSTSVGDTKSSAAQTAADLASIKRELHSSSEAAASAAKGVAKDIGAIRSDIADVRAAALAAQKAADGAATSAATATALAAGGLTEKRVAELIDASKAEWDRAITGKYNSAIQRKTDHTAPCAAAHVFTHPPACSPDFPSLPLPPFLVRWCRGVCRLRA